MFRIVSGVYDILLDEIMHRFAERSGFFFSSHCGVPRTSTRLSDVRRAVAAAAAPPCPLQERAVKGEDRLGMLIRHWHKAAFEFIRMQTPTGKINLC